VNLCAITPDGPTASKTFQKTDEGRKKAKEWIAEQNKLRNIYYQGASLTVLNKRPHKQDTTLIHFAHADIDTHGPVDQIEAEKKAILKKLRAYGPRPSRIILSGNGFQALWDLKEPLKATGTNIERLEAINKALAEALGGDPCHDVNHLLRLPGTLNHPNAKKRNNGRVVAAAKLIENDDMGLFAYSLDDFPQGVMKPEHAISGGEYGKIGSPLLPDHVDLARIPARVMKMIESGQSPKNKIIGDGSRSDLIYHVCCELRRKEYSDGEILSVILDAKYGISDHYADNPQREPMDQASRVILRMNQDGVVAESSIKFVWDDECVAITKPPTFISKDTRAILSDKAFDKAYGAATLGSKSDAHRLANRSKYMDRYEGVCYEPHVDGYVAAVMKDGRKLFNLWRPADIEPLEGEPTIFLDHIEYLIDDEQSREWFLDWLAWLVQQPEQKPMFAPLLIGPPRTGKSIIADVIEMILGPHNCSVPRAQDVANKFNGWLAEKQLIIIHEMKNYKGLADNIKVYITQPTVPLERKGFEAEQVGNKAAFLDISNDDDAVPMDESEARTLAIACARLPRYATEAPGSEPPYVFTQKSADYYTKLWNALFVGDPAEKKPGLEARRLFNYLRQRKIKLNCKLPAPATEARSEMIQASRNELDRWVHDRYTANLWPFKGRVFSVHEIVDIIVATLSIPAALRSQRAVEKSVKRLGCQPLGPLYYFGDGKQRRLWAKIGSEVGALKAMEDAEIVELYEAGGKPPKVKDDEPDFLTS
jgi:hypothetical protein